MSILRDIKGFVTGYQIPIGMVDKLPKKSFFSSFGNIFKSKEDLEIEDLRVKFNIMNPQDRLWLLEEYNKLSDTEKNTKYGKELNFLLANEKIQYKQAEMSYNTKFLQFKSFLDLKPEVLYNYEDNKLEELNTLFNNQFDINLLVNSINKLEPQMRDQEKEKIFNFLCSIFYDKKFQDVINEMQEHTTINPKFIFYQNVCKLIIELNYSNFIGFNEKFYKKGDEQYTNIADQAQDVFNDDVYARQRISIQAAGKGKFK